MKELHIIEDLEKIAKGINVIEIKDGAANADPLGLLGFGMTTFLLNVSNAGGYELDSMVMSMGIIFGGIA